jgi:polyphenol oxidase
VSGWRFQGGWLRLPSFEKKHDVFLGVTTRSLGDMKDPACFNRSFHRAGLDAARAAGGQQVHGKRVRWAARPTSFLGSAGTDGVATGRPDLGLRVYAADCAPVFLIDGGRRVRALVHAGWRGAAKGVLLSALRLMEEKGARTRDLWMAVGPCIHDCCYEVGEDVAAAFAAFPRTLKTSGAGKFRFDLPGVLAAQASRAGIRRDRISVCPSCTVCDGRFYSFRREKTGSRMAAVLAAKPV